jgi:hypothetical protein
LHWSSQWPTAAVRRVAEQASGFRMVSEIIAVDEWG